MVVVEAPRSPCRVLLTRRPRGARFAPDALVFPGGAVDPSDLRLGDPNRVAAARELFEEVGLLLAKTDRGRVATDADAASLRRRLARGACFADALQACSLVLDLAALAPLARIVTPPTRPLRFDTLFYIAFQPLGQSVAPQPAEVTEWFWSDPKVAAANLDLVMLPPTRAVLAWLGGVPDIRDFVIRRRRRRGDPAPVVRMSEIESGPEGGWHGRWPPR